jgi:general secretion pathway protein J
MAASWAQEGGGGETALMPVDGWQLFYFRENTWTPAGELPSGTSNPANPANPTGAIVNMPDGIRLVLNLSPGDGLAGAITRDWVKPTVGAPRS